MAMYRCAICGSPNVTRNERNEGFSYKKALVGTAVFGTVGAVAGINGKKDVVYICSDCGAELSQPMDMITKDKVETVLASPDVLVPILFPDMYDRFSYLRKERDMQRNQADSERLAALTNIISDQSNPLNISEAEFRQSAKEAIDAFCLLDRYARKYYRGTLNRDTKQHDFLEIPIKEEEAKQICSGLSRIKNIVYAISFYRNLIHDAYDLHTGLSRKELAVLMFVYVMMEYQEITMEDFYYAVTGDKLLNQSS